MFKTPISDQCHNHKESMESGQLVFSTNHLTGFHMMPTFRSSRPEVFCEKGVLRNFAKFTGKNLCQSNFFKKETLAQVFSSEFCEIPKNTFSYRIHPLAACVGLDALTSAQEDAWPLRTTHWYLPLKTLSANLNLFNTRKNEKTRYF